MRIYTDIIEYLDRCDYKITVEEDFTATLNSLLNKVENKINEQISSTDGGLQWVELSSASLWRRFFSL